MKKETKNDWVTGLICGTCISPAIVLQSLAGRLFAGMPVAEQVQLNVVVTIFTLGASAAIIREVLRRRRK